MSLSLNGDKTLLQKYIVNIDGVTEIKFDDRKTVRELVKYIFELFDYYELFGMEIVTLFQAHSQKKDNGWFISNLDSACHEAIDDPTSLLCIAYYKPGIFYYVEGGWGHHMIELGNHPIIPSPVMLHIRFDGFDNSVVINGNYSFKQVIDELIRVGYLVPTANKLII